MPKELEQKLMKEAKAKGLSKDRIGAYVYGTMRKTGWTPSSQRNSEHIGSDKHGNNIHHSKR